MSDIWSQMSEAAQKFRTKHESIKQALDSTSDEMTLSEALADILARHEPTRYGECSSCPNPPDSSWGITYPCEDVAIIADALGADL